MLRFLQWLLRREGLLRIASPAFGRFNPFLPEHRNDPHATWRDLRENAPVYRSRAFGGWLCTRYEDVLRILRDPAFSTDRSETAAMKMVMGMTRREPNFAGMLERNLLTLDGGEHRRLRRLVSKAKETVLRSAIPIPDRAQWTTRSRPLPPRTPARRGFGSWPGGGRSRRGSGFALGLRRAGSRWRGRGS